MNGFVYEEANGEKRCVSKCPYDVERYKQTESGGYYGSRVFKTRGFLSESKCECNAYSDLTLLVCHPDCDECVLYGPAYCTSCAKGKYLEPTSPTLSYGSCLVQDTSGTLF